MHTLLIVDDEPHSRDGLARLVRQSDLAIDQVQTASNGLDALALARQQAPDILLCDVRMPRMDGLTLATEVRRLFPGCQILFISGYSDREYLKTAFSLRAVDFIDKPINTVQLLDALRSALSNLEARRQQHDLLRERAAVELTVPGTHPCLARLRAQNTDFFAEPTCFCALLLLRAATDEDLRRTAECLLTLFPKALVAPLADSIVLHMPLYTPALLRETADGLFRALPGSENVFLAVGTLVKNADDLPSSFRAASALRERVFFAGYVTDTPLVLSQSDIFIFPSAREGLPVSVMEALAVGLPVIASDIRGVRDLVVHTKGGYLVHGHSSEDYAVKIRRIFTEKYGKSAVKRNKRRQQMGEFNMGHIKKFSIDVVDRQMRKIYADLLGGLK